MGSFNWTIVIVLIDNVSIFKRKLFKISACTFRGCSELYRIPMVEYKLDSEGTPCEYKTPFRRNTTWHRVPTTPGCQPLPPVSPTQSPEQMQCQPISQHMEISIPCSMSFERKLPDVSRYSLNITFYYLIFLHIINDLLQDYLIM